MLGWCELSTCSWKPCFWKRRSLSAPEHALLQLDLAVLQLLVLRSKCR